MITRKTTLVLATGMAFALAACGDNEAETVVPDPALVETEAGMVVDFDPMTRDYVLDEAATTRRAAFDADAFNREYEGYRNDISTEQDTDESTAAERQADMAGTDGATQTAASATPRPMGTRDATSNMRARSDMGWSYLDRNDDGKLSVAEYAIWAIPLDPANPKPNDETKPFVTAEQANKAADSFFYYDRDGDTYLSQREFTSARRGETFS